MASNHYVAIIERGAAGFGIFFPDIPGCVSTGETVSLATRNGEEALRGHLALMRRDGDAIPLATPPDAIQVDPDVQEIARVLIHVAYQ